MSKKQYIRISNEAPSIRIGTYLMWYLILEHFNAPQWVYGAAGLLGLILLIAAVVRMFTEEAVDVVKR